MITESGKSSQKDEFISGSRSLTAKNSNIDEERCKQECMNCIHPETGRSSEPFCDRFVAVIECQNDTQGAEKPVDPERICCAHEANVEQPRDYKEEMS